MNEEYENLRIDTAILNFNRLYGAGGDVRVFFAPGRVNLIGEHIDYNGGHVFPCALQVGTYIVARKTKDMKLRFFSENIPDSNVVERSLSNISYDKNMGWTNYLTGVISVFAAHGHKIHAGLDIYCYGNIPGSGLSSSASMEVCMAELLKDMYGFTKISRERLAGYCQEAENSYCGLNCGIMDQFACEMGKKGNAILLDCNKFLEENAKSNKNAQFEQCYRYVPLNLDGYKIIVTNSNKPHSLVTSHYNDRRRECDRALEDLQQGGMDIHYLCELSPEEFENHKALIKDSVCLRRAKHAVYEEQRTKDAVTALENNDILTFGRLVNESGDSLRYDYEATCPEIDFLVDEARLVTGVVGSRIIGGGWGGNTLTIIKDDMITLTDAKGKEKQVSSITYFKDLISKKYREKFRITPTFAVLEPGDGGRKLR